MKKFALPGMLLLIAVGIIYALYFKPDTVTVHDAWTKVAPPNAPMAGYFELHNHSDAVSVLIGASSDDFTKVMVHRSFEENGIAKMAHVDEVVIKNGEQISFEPGGFHLMLMQRTREFLVGEKTKVTLSFKDEMQLEIELEVKSLDAAGSSHSGH